MVAWKRSETEVVAETTGDRFELIADGAAHWVRVNIRADGRPAADDRQSDLSGSRVTPFPRGWEPSRRCLVPPCDRGQ